MKDGPGFHEMKDDPVFAVPLTAREWLERELPEVDRLLGEWVTTTSRILISADTGIGKTSFGMAIAAHSAAAIPFLHWHPHRMARVLYMDGEMSRLLLKQRIGDIVRRLGQIPDNLLFFNREDFEDFQPLNTPAGQMFLDAYIYQIGGVDLIIFDNIMALLDGDQKDEESWTRVLPLINSLTKRGIGQIWINHTGHDATRSYGSKTKEWRMDTTIHLTEIKRPDTDISFSLEFRKARERTPDNRHDFADVTIALVDDVWLTSTPPEGKGKPTDLENGFLEALEEALTSGEAVMFQGHHAVKSDTWRNACIRHGLLSDTTRTAFYRHRGNLSAKKLIKCHDDLSWKLS